MAKPLSVLVGASLASDVKDDLNRELKLLEKNLNKLAVKASFDGDFQKVIGEIKKAVLAIDFSKMTNGMNNAAQSVQNVNSGFSQTGKLINKTTKQVANLDDKLQSVEHTMTDLNGHEVKVKVNYDESGNVDGGTISNTDSTGTQRINAKTKAIKKLEAAEQELAKAKKIVATSENDAWDSQRVEAYEKEIAEARTKIESATTELKDFEKISKRLDNLKIDIRTDVNIADKWETQWNKINDKVEIENTKLASRFGGLYNSEKENEYRKIYNDLKRSVEELRKQKATWSQIRGKIDEAESKAKQFVAKLAAAQKQAKQTKKELDLLNNMFGRFVQYNTMSQVFGVSERAIREVATAVKDVDSAMVELRKVTDETKYTYDKFLDESSAKAKKLGVTMVDYINSVTEFARMDVGGFEAAKEVAESANIMQQVAEDLTATEASSYLISIMKAFNIEAKDTISIVDTLNELSNNFAITTDGLGSSLTRSAAAMRAANNSLEETAALTIAANNVIQNPESVGNALKTVSINKLVA